MESPMTTLTADASGQTLAQSFRAALRRLVAAVLKADARRNSGRFIWGRGF
jgi:hypothetical protein